MKKPKVGWRDKDVEAMICNPIYAGVGPYPPIVPQDQWVAAAAKAISEMGAERFLRTMLRELRSALEDAR